MTLFELVNGGSPNSKMSYVFNRTYVPLADVLEKATEEHMVELEKLAAESGFNLSDIITSGVSGVLLYISRSGKIKIVSRYVSTKFNFVEINLVV